MRRYFLAQFKNTNTAEHVFAVDTDETGEVSDRVLIPDEWLARYFGDESGYWECEECDEITEAQARRECGDMPGRDVEFRAIPVVELVAAEDDDDEKPRIRLSTDDDDADDSGETHHPDEMKRADCG